MELDIDDFMEEVKFQMTEYEIMEKDIILDWEEKTRAWVEKHKDKKFITYRAKDDIFIKVKDENVMFQIAERYYHAVRKNQTEEYWKKFQLV